MLKASDEWLDGEKIIIYAMKIILYILWLDR